VQNGDCLDCDLGATVEHEEVPDDGPGEVAAEVEILEYPAAVSEHGHKGVHLQQEVDCEHCPYKFVRHGASFEVGELVETSGQAGEADDPVIDVEDVVESSLEGLTEEEVAQGQNVGQQG
jgi:hypothetical protein